MRWIACLAACLVSASALAATLQVSPVRITISADGKAGVVRLHNQSDVPTLVQVEALAWNDAADLAEVPRTNEILAVPPVFEIAAGAEQLIRLALRKPLTTDTEAAYRLLITEVPRAVGDGTEGVSFALRLNLPVFVTPEGALAAAELVARARRRRRQAHLGQRGQRPCPRAEHRPVRGRRC